MVSYSKSYQFKCKPDKLFQLLISDALKEFGKSIKNKDEDILHSKIEREYQTKQGQIKTTIEITEYLKNKRYTVVTKLMDDIYTVQITFKELEPKVTELTYKEMFDSKTKIKKMSTRLFGFVYKRKFNKRMKQLFKQIELKV